MPTDSSRPLAAQVSAPASLPAADVDTWRTLTESEPSLRSAFLSFPFAAAASLSRPVRVTVLSQAGKNVGYFPFQFHSRLHRAMGLGERVGGELSDCFGVVARAGLQLTPFQLLRLSRLNAIYFTHLDESQRRFGLDAAAEETGLLIDLAAGPDVFWENLRRRDAKFVSDTLRRERKLVESHGPMAFAFQCSDMQGELEHVIRMKRGRYASTQVDDPLRPPAALALLRDLAQLREPDCCAVLSTLHAGGQWVASHFGLLCHGTLHYWFPVYNPEMHRFAPGRLLLKAIIDSAHTGGVRLIDRGSGDTQSKREFATGRRSLLRGIWQRPSLQAAAYRAALSAGWRLERWRRPGKEERG